MSKVKALFILKRREDYNTDIPGFTNYTVATGMYNSARFVSDMLNDNGIDSQISVVIDNNCIDREVTNYKPTHVFIEGFWVVPEKFDVLKPLHPDVTWIVRCHSELPFLSQEGIAMDWIKGYLSRGVAVSGNAARINKELQFIGELMDIDNIENTIPLLPNYYPVINENVQLNDRRDGYIDVGCFGAVRPLKNHLLQAEAALIYAERRGLKLRFHINSNRVEMNGSNALKNLKGLFNGLTDHSLIEHPWSSHEDFLAIIRTMDICMQVSFTETFNIVTADAVEQGVPVLVSDEIPWVIAPKADPNSTEDIIEKMDHVLKNSRMYIKKNRIGLKNYSENSKYKWVNYLMPSKTHSTLSCLFRFWS